MRTLIKRWLQRAEILSKSSHGGLEARSIVAGVG
jgi:hypothetical protein